MKDLVKIGFSGGCHWCTEAVFQSINGVEEVEQGFIATNKDPEIFYEGVIVNFKPLVVSIKKLIEIHLHTHQSTSNHSMRSKYLSAVYTFENSQQLKVKSILEKLQNDFSDKIITRAYMFGNFKASRKEIRNYYKTDPERPFCKVYIEPKLERLKMDYSSNLK